MKKIIQTLITFSILFFGINGVKALGNEVASWQDTGTCTVTEHTNDTCSYRCDMSVSAFDYKVYIQSNNINFEIVNPFVYNGESLTGDGLVSDFINATNTFTSIVSGEIILEKLAGFLFDVASPVVFDNNTNNPPRTYFVNNGKLNCSPIIPVVNYTFNAMGTAYVQFRVGPVYINQDPSYVPDNTLDNNSEVCGFLGNEDSKTVAIFRKLYKYLKVLIPVLIILLGIVDFIKVVVTGKDDDMKKAINRFVKRIIVAVIFVLVPVLIQLFINISGLTSEYSGINDGIRAILCILD